MPGHDKSSIFAWPGAGLAIGFIVISRRNGVAQSCPFTVAQRERHQCGFFRWTANPCGTGL